MNFEKTDEGRLAIQKRHVKLTPCQRAVLITVNGSKDYAALLIVAASMGGGASDVDMLAQMGLIVGIAEPEPEPAAVPGPVPASTLDSAPQRAQDIEPDVGVAFDAVQNSDGASMSIESLWPESVEPEPLLAASPPTPQALPVADLEAARAFALSVLKPLGLRAVQLRRTVEAAATPAQLLDVEPLIRELLTADQKQQLDSAFFGL